MENMMPMLDLYKWSIVAGVFSAMALSLLGIQLATRDRGMQTMCVAQGAMFGVLLSLALVGGIGVAYGVSVPLFGSLLCAALCFLITDWVASRKPASKNTFFAFVFSFLLAMSHLVSSLFPALENHLTQIYFGDLATLGTQEAIYASVFSFIGFVLLVQFRYFFSLGSFLHAMYGVQNMPRASFWKRNAFNFLAVFMICLSVQFLGFLFTISVLFIPTAILNFSPEKGLMKHLSACAFFAAFSAGAGFLLSLYMTHLPTAPTIVAILVATLSSYMAFQWLVFLFARLLDEYLHRKSHTVFESAEV